ncbi:unnamed protein product [Cylindrotheca closterium]|uniref:Uncharacterized protein n=1 Tax=Cylindrotheca closterium TaxID=2856 RepID=A0AAD2FTD4_9STRA|nr:unnamed protein product [Cylindrotheca closterium]
MTLIYEPRRTSKGRRIVKRSRPRRRRNNSPSSSRKTKANKAPTKTNQEQLVGEDLLDFCNQLEATVPKLPKSTDGHKSQKTSSKRPCASNINVAQSGNRRRPTALAVDTRFMEVLRDNDLSSNIIQNVQSLLQMTAHRGVAPSVLSISELQQTQKGVSSIRVHSSSPSNADLKPLYIPTQSLQATGPENHETVNNDGMVFHLPKLLSAKASWKLFGDYVVSAMQSPIFQESPPCHNLTLLTNDVSFLSHTGTANHADGLNAFWERCKPFFLEHRLNSIEIVVLWTNAQIINTNDDEFSDNVTTEDDAEKRSDGERETEEEQVNAPPPRQTVVAECIASLNQQLREKEEAEFRANRSNIQFDVTQHIPSIEMSVFTVENSILGMMSMLRKWSRDEVPGPQRLPLNLPDTSDTSIHKALVLDGTYKTIPFALDSSLMVGLQNDLKLLAQSKLEVTKMVPIESIDASLLYGVPIRVRSGLQADMESHQAMVQMVQTLFHHLSQKEQALIITSSLPSATNTGGLFQSSHQHIFVLMAEEIPLLLRSTIPPSTGILMRLATSDHFIEEAGAFDVVSTIDANAKNPFFESMEQILGSIAYSDSNVGYNPVYTSAFQARHRPIEHQSEEDSSVPSETRNENIEVNLEDKWNDNSGVGSSEAALNAAQVVTATLGTRASLSSQKKQKRVSSKQCESELEELDTSGLQRRREMKSIPCTVDRNLFSRTGTGKPTVNDELEWTDDEGVTSLRLGELSSDSDDSDDIKESSVAVFEYSD